MLFSPLLDQYASARRSTSVASYAACRGGIRVDDGRSDDDLLENVIKN